MVGGTLEPKITNAGDTAPNFKVVTEDGKTITRGDFGGKLLVLNFWASWCPPCVSETPSLEEFAREMAPQGVVVLGVSSDRNENLYRKFIQRFGITFKTARDPQADISASYGTFQIPETYLIDRNGKIARKSDQQSELDGSGISGAGSPDVVMIALAAEVEKLLGRQGYLHKPEDLTLYEYDGGIDKARPDLVVFPQSRDDVVAIVKLARERGVPIVGRGAGTGLSGGAIPRAGGMVVSFARMNRILEIDLANERAVVEPGVVNIDISNAVDADGYFYAPDPSSQGACTIGGNVAENSGGRPARSPTASPRIMCWDLKRCWRTAR